MKILAAIATLVISVIVATPSATGALLGPPAPTNLEVIATTEDSITVAWGPSQPGEFYFIAGTKTSVTVGWGASQDVRSPVTYTLTRDGGLVVASLPGTRYRLTGVSPKTKNFRTCVQAFNAAGQSSPQMCATWSRT